jgi:hypothetical protein
MTKKAAQRKRAARRGCLIPGLLLAGGAALLGLAALSVFSGGREEFVPEVVGAAAVRVDRQQEDLGDVRLGQPVRVAFELTNVGDRQLRFTAAPYVEVAEGC